MPLVDEGDTLIRASHAAVGRLPHALRDLGRRHVAHMLESHVTEVRRRELRALADLCRVDHAHACELWLPLRHALGREPAAA